MGGKFASQEASKVVGGDRAGHDGQLGEVTYGIGGILRDDGDSNKECGWGARKASGATMFQSPPLFSALCG